MRSVFLVVAVVALFGFVPDQTLPDPKQEAQAQYIISQLRCFVCQGQPLAQSDVALARDLRRLVRQQVAEGKSQQDIIAFITERYGDQVLMNPPLNRRTFILWLMPFFALALGGCLLWRSQRARRL